MVKKFEKPLFSDQGYPVYMLDCLGNGSFTTKVMKDCGVYGMKDEKTFFVIHDAYGKKVNDSWMWTLLKGGWLEKGERAIQPSEDKLYIIKYPVCDAHSDDPFSVCFWNLTNPSEAMWAENMVDDVRLFAHGWYEVSAGMRFLQVPKVGEIARYFGHAEVFTQGFALQTDDIVKLKYGKFEVKGVKFDNDKTWLLFPFGGDQYIIRTGIERFIGDGNRLMHDGKHMALYTFRGSYIADLIVKAEAFPCGRFWVEYADGKKQMFSSGGQEMTPVLEGDGFFLPDGRFVHTKNQPYHVGEFGKNAPRPQRSMLRYVIENQTVGNVTLAGDYYIIDGVLYNIEGEKMGEKYALVHTDGPCALFKHEKSYELFNQNGKVAVFPAL